VRLSPVTTNRGRSADSPCAAPEFSSLCLSRSFSARVKLSAISPTRSSLCLSSLRATLIKPSSRPRHHVLTHNVTVHTAHTLELACADSWPPLVLDKIGDWRLRAAADTGPDGRRIPFTGRANSVLAVGDPGVPVPRALDLVCEFAHAHGIPPMAQTLKDGPFETALTAEGWVPNEAHAAGFEVSVLTAPPAQDDTGEVSWLHEPDPGWWELTTGGAEPSPAERAVLTGGPVVGFGAVRDGEPTAGVVRAVVVDDVLVVSRLAVSPEYRRRGLASALMNACGTWGAARGATVCALQVTVHNEPALGLYRNLGFTEHHRYRYWVPGPGAACEDPTS
jgi:ribosomal protein S18 acetylase RimI-like enzyme